MRKKSTRAWLAAFLTLATAACSSASPGNPSTGKASSSPSDNGALNPAGNTATPSATATSTPAGLRAYPFPASLRPEFQTTLPASGEQRAAVIGYENFIDSMWYAIYTYGADTTYKAYMAGNALTYVQGLIKDVSNGHQKLNGKIIYYDISVPLAYANDVAEVQACIDTSGLYYVDPKTGKDNGNFYKSYALHYQEQVTISGQQNGIWHVSHVVDTSASAGGSAGACT